MLVESLWWSVCERSAFRKFLFYIYFLVEKRERLTSIPYVSAGEDSGMQQQAGNDGGSGLNLLSGFSTADTRAVRRPRNGEQFRAALSDGEVRRRATTTSSLIIMPRATNYVTCSIFTPMARVPRVRTGDDKNVVSLSVFRDGSSCA